MNVAKEPFTIKKYANRRLYNTAASSYVTLEDLACMVKGGQDFLVYDAKSGDDITRSVLAQIIFEQEAKVGQNLLPIAFLRQLIRFYGDSMQSLVPSYLEFSLARLTGEQQHFRDHFAETFSANPFSQTAFQSLEDLTRKNMAMFSQAFSMFSPFAAAAGVAPEARADAAHGALAPPAPQPQPSVSDNARDLLEVKEQLAQLRDKLEKLSDKA